jgi:hypothetical protein
MCGEAGIGLLRPPTRGVNLLYIRPFINPPSMVLSGAPARSNPSLMPDGIAIPMRSRI